MSAEKAIIGAALLGGSHVVDEACLTSEDFFDVKAVRLWRFIVDQAALGVVVDQIAAISALPTLHSFIFECTSACPSVSSANFYAAQVRELSLKRRMAQIGAQLAQEAVTEGSVGDSLIEQTYRDLDGLAGSRVVDNISWLFENLDDYTASFDVIEKNATCGIKKIDSLLNGFRPGALYVIGARPAVGKTVVGLQVAFGLSRTSDKLPTSETAGGVAFFSLEMSKRELMNRLVSQVYEIDMGKLDRKEISSQERRLIDAHSYELSRMLTINDRAAQSLASIKNYIRSIKRSGVALKAVVIDYIGLISEANTGRNRYEAMTYVSGALKALAKDFNIPVIVLAQLNRALEGRKDSGPMMADLRDSGSIEQDADVVMLLHRKTSITSVAEWDLNVMQIAVVKNRHGKTGVMDFNFEGKYSRITDSPK